MLSALSSWAYGTQAAPQADGEATIPAVKTESEPGKSEASKTEDVKTETTVNKATPQIGKRVSQMFKRGSHAPKSTEPVPPLPLPQASKVEPKETKPPAAKPEPQITKRVSQMFKKVVPASKPTPQVPVPPVPEGSKTPPQPSRPLLQTSKTAPESGKTANKSKSPQKATKALPPSKTLPTAPLPAAPGLKDEDKKTLSPPATPEPPKPGKLSRLKSVPNLFKVSLTDLAPSHGLDHHPKLSETTASPAISTKSTFQDADTPPASAMPKLRHVLSRKFTRPSLKTNGNAASTPAVPTVPTDKKDGGGGFNRKGMWKKMASMGDLRSRYGAVPSGMVVAA